LPSYAELLGETMQWGVSLNRYEQLSAAVAQCLAECDCTTADRICMWCAQTGHESMGLLYMEEQDWNGDNYAYLEGRCSDLGNCSPGDGAKYHGRGPIQVTGKYNYTECSAWAHSQGLVPTPTYFVDLPDELADDDNGFHGVTWYWTTQRPMNDYADARDIEGATYAINGGYHGLDDRIWRYEYCLGMGDRILGLLNAGLEWVPQHQWDALVANVADIRAQLRGPHDQGWPQLGQNPAGQNLSVVDALASVKVTVEHSDHVHANVKDM